MEFHKSPLISLKWETRWSLKMGICTYINLNLNLNIIVKKDTSALMDLLILLSVDKFIFKNHKIKLSFIEKRADSHNSLIKMVGWTKLLNSWASKETKRQDNFQTEIEVLRYRKSRLKINIIIQQPYNRKQIHNISEHWQL